MSAREQNHETAVKNTYNKLAHNYEHRWHDYVWTTLRYLSGRVDLKGTEAVLDVGCGAGKYGVLAREYLDLWSPEVDGSPESYHARRTRIDAVEIHAAYITDLHRFIYDEVIVGDILTVELSRCYEVILLSDVLEHFDRKQGEALVRRLLELCGHLLIATPKTYYPQGSWFGNAAEAHLSAWTPEDFPGCEVIAAPESWVMVLKGAA